MKITAVKICQFLKPGLVLNGYAATVEIQHVLIAQLLDDAVGMYRGDAHGFAKLLLRKRHVELVPFDLAYNGKTLPQLYDHVSEPVRGWPLPDIYNPLTKNGRVDQRVAPEEFGDVWLGAYQGPQGSMTNEAEGRWDQRNKIVIHHVQMQTLKIRYFAGDMDRENLPLAGSRRLGPDAKALDNEAAFAGTVTVAHDVSTAIQPPDDDRKGADCLDIGFLKP
jgi:hypothetical protein